MGAIQKSRGGAGGGPIGPLPTQKPLNILNAEKAAEIRRLAYFLGVFP
jgi:hypothetical protein